MSYVVVATIWLARGFVLKSTMNGPPDKDITTTLVIALAIVSKSFEVFFFFVIVPNVIWRFVKHNKLI